MKLCVLSETLLCAHKVRVQQQQHLDRGFLCINDITVNRWHNLAPPPWHLRHRPALTQNYCTKTPGNSGLLTVDSTYVILLQGKHDSGAPTNHISPGFFLYNPTQILCRNDKSLCTHGPSQDDKILWTIWPSLGLLLSPNRVTPRLWRLEDTLSR